MQPMVFVDMKLYAYCQKFFLFIFHFTLFFSYILEIHKISINDKTERESTHLMLNNMKKL